MMMTMTTVMVMTRMLLMTDSDGKPVTSQPTSLRFLMLIVLAVSMTPMTTIMSMNLMMSMTTMNHLEVCDAPTSRTPSAPFPGIHFHSGSTQRSQEAGSE